MEMIEKLKYIKFLTTILFLSINTNTYALSPYLEQAGKNIGGFIEDPVGTTVGEVERLQESSGYQTNKFDLKARVEEGGWTVAWADDISETDVAQGLVAAGVSIYSSNPAAFMEWVNYLVDRTINSLYADMQEEYAAKAVELATRVIISALKGQSAEEIAKSMDTVDFKAGAIRYSGRNYLANQTISRTWGMKPYVAFRIRSSSAKKLGDNELRTDFSSKQENYEQGQVTSVNYQLEEKKIEVEKQKNIMQNDIEKRKIELEDKKNKRESDREKWRIKMKSKIEKLNIDAKREKNKFKHTENMSSISSKKKVEMFKTQTDFLKTNSTNAMNYLMMNRQISSEELKDVRRNNELYNLEKSDGVRDKLEGKMKY